MVIGKDEPDWFRIGKWKLRKIAAAIFGWHPRGIRV